MAESNYEYPRLRRPEIVTILAQLQIANVTEQDFTNPNPDFISDLYTRVLIHLDILLEEDNEQLEFHALEHLENPDFHLDSVRAVKLYNQINEVLTTLECPRKFTLADLLMPDPHRTDLFLGSLLNFCLDRDARMNSVSEIVEEVNALEAQRTELEENRILQLKAEISECNEAKEREMPLVEEVEAKVKELKQTIAVLNSNQSSLRSTLRKLKEKTGETDEKISNAEFTLVQNVQENANLRSKISQSPDKVQRALEEKKLAREEARNAERLAMQAFHEKTALVEVFSKVYKKMSKHNKLMQDIQEQVNSAKSIEKDLKALKAKLSDEEILEKSLEAKLVEKQSKVEQMEESRKQLEKESNIMWEEATKYLSSTKSDVESKRSATETRQKNVEAVLSEVDAISSKIISVKEAGAVKVALLVRKCEELVEADTVKTAGGEISGEGIIETFHNDDEALAAVDNGVVVVDLSHFGRIRVSGEDRIQFLHNQSTANFESLHEGQGCDTVFVTPTARTIDIAHAWLMKNAITLVVSPETCTTITEMLNKYIFFADKVEIQDITKQTSFFVLVGPKSGQVMENLNLGDLVGKPYGTHLHFNVDKQPITIGVGNIISEDGFSLLMSPAAAASIWKAILSQGAIPMGSNAWNKLRIIRGRPTPGMELTNEFNVLEACLWNSVSLNKGCYKGQETISRLITYDGIKQRLWGFHLSAAAEPGSIITVDGKKVGKLTSYTSGRKQSEHFGLGYIKRRAASEGDTVIVGDNIKGTVVEVPFLLQQRPPSGS